MRSSHTPFCRFFNLADLGAVRDVAIDGQQAERALFIVRSRQQHAFRHDTLELGGLEGFTPTVGGWSEISLKIDKTKSDGGFDIKNVTSVRFKSEVASGALALIGYDNIRVALKTPEYEQGDVDADGSITVTDALTILQYSVKKITLLPKQTAVADLNGDGRVTVTDALLTLKASLAA